VDLTAVASLGSAVAVAISTSPGSRLPPQSRNCVTGLVLTTGLLLTAVVLLVFAVQTLRTEPVTFVAIIAIVCLAVVLDLIWSLVDAYVFRHHHGGRVSQRRTSSHREHGNQQAATGLPRRGACVEAMPVGGSPWHGDGDHGLVEYVDGRSRPACQRPDPARLAAQVGGLLWETEKPARMPTETKN
jgi:membrane protein implicated in regulation of membrane protease activity